MSYGEPNAGFLAVLAVLWVGSVAWDRRDVVLEPVRDVVTGPEPSPVEQLQADFVDGRIDREEFERRLRFALDNDAEVVRAELTPVDGVGEKRAEELAREFGTVEAVRRASDDDLRSVDGIGEETADAIREHF